MRDRNGTIMEETVTATGTATSNWYDLGGGTPNRGLPVVWNQVQSVSAGTITTGLTIEASDTTASAQETVAQMTTVNSNATPYSQQTKTIHTNKRYIRAVRTLTGNTNTISAISQVHSLEVTSANPT